MLTDPGEAGMWRGRWDGRTHMGARLGHLPGIQDLRDCADILVGDGVAEWPRLVAGTDQRRRRSKRCAAAWSRAAFSRLPAAGGPARPRRGRLRRWWRVDIKSETQLAEEEAYASEEWAQGEWVIDPATGEQVWQPADGGEALSAEAWAQGDPIDDEVARRRVRR